MATCRPLTPSDYADALALYQALSADRPSGVGGAAQFNALLDHPGSTIWGADLDGRVVSMATLHLLPNMTYGGRPYALVENVVTLATHRQRGFGRQVMEAIAQAAWAQDCYKVMLLTGRQNRAKGFYQSLGYDPDEKYGMVLRHNGS